ASGRGHTRIGGPNPFTKLQAPCLRTRDAARALQAHRIPMEIVEARNFERPPQQPQGSGSAASIGNAAAPSSGRQPMT
ncbi:MAG TPA: hypothetical protein VLL28_00235, partial [Hyphomicrobiaceae bacterium]|nr:hypothetical protein [Hyphomicrobiaceae bacterium]